MYVLTWSFSHASHGTGHVLIAPYVNIYITHVTQLCKCAYKQSDGTSSGEQSTGCNSIPAAKEWFTGRKACGKCPRKYVDIQLIS